MMKPILTVCDHMNRLLLAALLHEQVGLGGCSTLKLCSARGVYYCDDLLLILFIVVREILLIVFLYHGSYLTI